MVYFSCSQQGLEQTAGSSIRKNPSINKNSTDVDKPTGRTLIITSGYFDPVHRGHIEYLKKAEKLGDNMVILINTRAQAIMKKGYEFQDISDRIYIMENLFPNAYILIVIDKDQTVCESIKQVVSNFRGISKFIFAKGGDRLEGEIPERKICKELNVEIVDGLGSKIRSSSDMVKRIKEMKGGKENGNKK